MELENLDLNLLKALDTCLEQVVKTPPLNYSLDDLSRRYDILLFDTNALIRANPLDRNNMDNGHPQAVREQERFMHYLKELFLEKERDFPLHITRGVFEEYSKPSVLNPAVLDEGIYAKKRIKGESAFSECFKKMNTPRKKRFRKSNRKRSGLLDIIDSFGHVLELDEREKMVYRSVYEKVKKCHMYFKLSNVDRDLITSAVVVGLMRGNTVIISNDNPLHKVWIYLLSRDFLYPNSCDFYFRRGYDNYVLARTPSK